ncbi:hypothetical protein [Altererythrobacter sp. TH136]|uniref:hypothetical protein n=1 Tax=Altererythrobacter sp. TH136 TaxID=2067415 RepID=UPI001164B6E0|nr:hypothetical protein [Altererythrobacter sp. TH136]QDM40190.1 hypothetical protein C0V74_03310 [Altererythrobacter sp. TH136]
MTISRSKFETFQGLVLSNPVVWVALGSGLIAGVVIAAGFKMDGTDAARFVGALLGSLIAVGGAVSLYFLKEQKDAYRRRYQFREMLTQLKSYSDGIPEQFAAQNFSQVSAGIKVTKKYMGRCLKFADAHEADDLAISRSASWLENDYPSQLAAYHSDADQYGNGRELLAFVEVISQATDEALNSLKVYLK